MAVFALYEERLAKQIKRGSAGQSRTFFEAFNTVYLEKSTFDIHNL